MVLLFHTRHVKFERLSLNIQVVTPIKQIFSIKATAKLTLTRTGSFSSEGTSWEDRQILGQSITVRP